MQGEILSAVLSLAMFSEIDIVNRVVFTVMAFAIIAVG